MHLHAGGHPYIRGHAHHRTPDTPVHSGTFYAKLLRCQALTKAYCGMSPECSWKVLTDDAARCVCVGGGGVT